MIFVPGLLKVFWIAFVTAAIFSYPVYRILLALKSRQTVSQFAPEGHQVKQGTPTMGGLMIILGLIAGGVSILTLSYGDPGSRIPSSPVISGLLLVILFASIGFIDDFVVPRVWKGKRGLGWKQKIFLEFAFAGLALIPIYHHADLLTWGLTIFAVLFFANAYNFSDGLDALAGTLLLTMSVGLLGIAAVAGLGVSIGFWCVALIAACIPFLFFNAPPAKIFMGDVGSLGIGALLGLLVTQAIGQSFNPEWLGAEEIRFQATSHSPVILVLALFVWSVMMIVELVPVPLQIASVKLLKRKLFLYTPIHHAFEKVGWKETRIVGMFALIQLLLSIIAVTIISCATVTTALSVGVKR